MQRRIRFLIKLVIVIMGIFAIQKILFMIANHSFGTGTTLGNVFQVIWHGFSLDLVMTSYIMIVPLITLTVSSFFESFRLRRSLYWWYLLISFLTSTAFLADAMLYHYWGAKIDAADLMYLKSPKEMLASLEWWKYPIILICISIGTILEFIILRHITPREIEPTNPRYKSITLGIVMLGLTCIGMRGGLSESTANPGYAYFTQNRYLNHAALNPMFNFIHSFTKSEDLAHEMEFYSQDEMQRLTKGVFASSPDIDDPLLTDTRPDIIFLVWEGGGSLMSGNPEIAPHFARLKAEGVFFSNLYANNFRTDRGLVSLLNGWPGLPTTSLMKMRGRCGNLPSIAKSLKKEGYTSEFFYGGDIDFTNMRGYLYETGYDQVHGMEDFDSDVKTSKWGIDDEYILDISHFKHLRSPFQATILTLSSHEPWEVPYQKLDDRQANSFAYTDSCIHMFVSQLKRSPIWNNLLLIIVPDHGVANDDFIPQDVEVAKIPMLWIGGAVYAPKIISTMMNQSDIAATLLAQMGIDASRFPFSRNVTSPTYKPTILMHAYKNGLNIIDTLGSSRFDIVNGQLSPVGNPHRPDAQQATQALLQLIYHTSGKK